MAASYRAGVAWIALNDEPNDYDTLRVSELISTMLLAELFSKDAVDVAAAIVRYRVKHEV